VTDHLAGRGGIAAASGDDVRLGLRANWRQFALLVLVNAFVGALVGLERAVLPLLAEAEFGVASKQAVLAFVAAFGLAKALANLGAGRWGDRFGRRGVLIAGWLLGLPVPFLIIWAPSWDWIVAANLLLGLNQGLTWSTTVIMKIDLAGPKRRGLAMGLNEFAGYLAVAVAALAAGLIAERFGYRPAPFYLGIAVAVAGLALSLLFIHDTTAHVTSEAQSLRHPARGAHPRDAGFLNVFALVSWRDRTLSSVSQAGLVNNLNDGLAWGLLPLFFAAGGLAVSEVSLLAFLYPAVWSVTQLVTGPLSDRWGRKWLIVVGMWLQGAALALIAISHSFTAWAAESVLLGVGTAMVYPTLLAALGDVAHPTWRGSAIGVYRLWRDLGYVVGALAAGLIADRLGSEWAILLTGVVTLASGLVVAARMRETASGRSIERADVSKRIEQAYP
jgi:MFS family permease